MTRSGGLGGTAWAAEEGLGYANALRSFCSGEVSLAVAPSAGCLTRAADLSSF